MRRLLTTFAVLVLGLAVLPARADDKDKDKDKNKKDPAADVKKDDAVNTDKTIKAGTVVGKVVEVNETAKSLKIEVSYEVSKPNVGEIQAVANAKVNLANALRNRDYNGALSAQRDMAYHSIRVTTMERQTKNVDVESTDEVKVRLADPPAAYDDKGNIKKRTEKELKALKGDPKDPDYKLPGYPAQFSDIRQGSYVRVSLVKKKENHPAPKSKDADPDLALDNLPQASLVEILADPMPAK
jgi:preprotein translocase subunit YajC